MKCFTRPKFIVCWVPNWWVKEEKNQMLFTKEEKKKQGKTRENHYENDDVVDERKTMEWEGCASDENSIKEYLWRSIYSDDVLYMKSSEECRSERVITNVTVMIIENIKKKESERKKSWNEKRKDWKSLSLAFVSSPAFVSEWSRRISVDSGVSFKPHEADEFYIFICSPKSLLLVLLILRFTPFLPDPFLSIQFILPVDFRPWTDQ